MKLTHVWMKAVHGYREFADGKPGRRFIDTHDRWNCPGQHPLVGWLMLFAGVALIIVGVLLGFVPGVPGIVLMVLGLALISTRFRWMAKGLDWCEIKCREFWKRMRRNRHSTNRVKNSPPVAP